VCKRDDDYVAPGKPGCDWDDAEARATLIDALARDAYALLAALDGRTLDAEVQQAAQLLATVVGQDLEQTADGTFRIARRVAADRVISTVDPQTRHGHKTAARGFDGYKGHVAIDPDSEIITATEVTPGNVADGTAAKVLLAEVLSPKPRLDALEGAETVKAEPVEVYGDASYGTAELVEHIEAAGAVANVKVQAPSAPSGHYGKNAFTIDLDAQTVKCPAGVLVQIRKRGDGSGHAAFAAACVSCAQRSKCTDAKAGRVISVHPREATLQRSRAAQSGTTWKTQYRSTRPKVERKLAHLVFRRHGGRRARLRGCERNRHDFALLAAAHNLKRLSALGVRYDGRTWATA
jgi:hypothetical protein